MAYQYITTEIDSGVMKITLNRPDVLNSFTLAMSRELRQALEVLDRAVAEVVAAEQLAQKQSNARVLKFGGKGR